MFSNETYENIKSRILERIQDKIDTREGSFTNDMVSPVSVELAKTYMDMNIILDIVFLKTTANEFLDRKTSDMGVYRKEGTRAIGTVKFYGSDRSIVPLGTILTTENGLKFETLGEVELSNGEATVDVEALEIGSESNLLVGVDLYLDEDLDNINYIKVYTEFKCGTDEESDEDLKERYIDYIRKNFTSGNPAHYVMWTKEVEGVGDCKVYPLWDKDNGQNGNGSVKVVVCDSNMVGASSELTTKVFNHIENNRPIGATVTVISAIEKSINISANIVLAAGYSVDEVKETFNINLKNYLKSISFKDTYVSVARLGNLLLDTDGVIDYTNFKVNNGTINIPLEDDEVPISGTILLEV